MRFEKWEEEAFNYLTKLYDNFFEELSSKCMECFRIDSKELFSENVKELTSEQEKKIYDFWKKYRQELIKELNNQPCIEKTAESIVSLAKEIGIKPISKITSNFI